MIAENVIAAFVSVFTPHNLLLMSIGVLAGLVAGAIPGFTITMAVVLTLPFTFGMAPVEGLSTMIGVFVGALTGGLFACALIGIPGTPSAIATTFDAFPMARAGRPGLALGIGIWASFFAGIISAALLAVLAPSLAAVGLEFGPWDYFMLIAFALTMAASLAGENLLKGLIAGVLGLLFACVGEDRINGVARFTYGIEALKSGFDFLPVLVGLFAFSQLLSDLADPEAARVPMLPKGSKVARVDHWGGITQSLRHWPSLIRSTLIGLFVGILPAVGGSVSNILAWDQEKKASKHPERFGSGIPEGVIASEAANNSTAGGALITLMALGIPGDVVTAIMLGALTIHNVAPSPTFISTYPNIAYAIIIAYFLSNFVTLALQGVALRMFVMLMRIPLYAMASVILFYCAIGVFSLNNSIDDIWTLLAFGVLGYVMMKTGFPLAPMILGVVLGPIAETNLSRSLATDTDLSLFFLRPWAMFFLILGVFSVFFPWYQSERGKARWTPYYMPALGLTLSIPLFLMQGWARPVFGLVLVAVSGYFAWRSLTRRDPGLPTASSAE
ncbi:MAG TPA: tripartite tricarboxylate transporter permease [Hyphomicrobiaceae bacterium]|nr:tripartite tricarboxylate transporter permease [Hyphomicrobiaceae bacterium]